MSSVFVLSLTVCHLLLMKSPGVASHGVYLCQSVSECPGLRLPQQCFPASLSRWQRQRGNSCFYWCGERKCSKMNHTSTYEVSLFSHHVAKLSLNFFQLFQNESGVREFHIVQVSSSSQHWRLHKYINPCNNYGKSILKGTTSLLKCFFFIIVIFFCILFSI